MAVLILIFSLSLAFWHFMQNKVFSGSINIYMFTAYSIIYDYNMSCVPFTLCFNYTIYSKLISLRLLINRIYEFKSKACIVFMYRLFGSNLDQVEAM